MSSLPEFTIQLFQNEYLPEGGGEVNAIVTVNAKAGAGDWTAEATTEAAEVIIIDCSGSMENPPAKIAKAKEATAAAIDELRDGVAFAVVAGTHTARVVWPPTGTLAEADAQSRIDAKEALRRLHPGGGTAIGSWLMEARRLLAERPHAIRHAILLTDGRNEHESPDRLAKAVRACEGQFRCDCRGVGTDWVFGELERIASGLLGTVQYVAEPDDLAEDFRAMVVVAMDKHVAEVVLRLWTAAGAELRFLKQMSPTLEDLTTRRVEFAGQTGDYPTGSWGTESRDYHLMVDVTPGGVGERMNVGRVTLVNRLAAGTEEALGAKDIFAEWTNDLNLSTQITPEVAHYTGQAELAQLTREGLDAVNRGDEPMANEKLGRALVMAKQSGNDQLARTLDQIGEGDPETGTWRIKRMTAEDELILSVSTKQTIPIRRE
jgi:hypothetical protein